MTPSPANDVRLRLSSALQQADNDTRDGRVERMIQASAHAVPFGIIHGRIESLALLEEARMCYVNGQNIAALIVALSYVEHALADALSPRGGPSK